MSAKQGCLLNNHFLRDDIHHDRHVSANVLLVALPDVRGILVCGKVNQHENSIFGY
jgi:hypothetical protein